MSHRKGHLLAEIILGVLVVAPMPTTANAAEAELSLSLDVGPPTTVTVITADYFTPEERVALGFDHRRVGTTRAGLDGTLSEEVNVPAEATPGEDRISARGALSAEATATFKVQTDWPTARFVPEGTGHNPYENVLSPSNVGQLELAWSFDSEGTLNTTPIVVDGVVYVAGHIVGTGGSEVTAVDASTGEVMWSRRDGGHSPSDMAVAHGVLYVSFLTDHVLRAYDAATGELRWEFPGPTMAPTVVNGVVYAADHLRKLWAIDAETGRKRWVTKTRVGGFGVGVAVASGVVHAGGHELDGTSPVYAYDAASGALVWRTNTGGAVDPTPAVLDETVYVSSGDQFLYAMNAGTGRVRWTADVGGTETSSPAAADGAVYLGSTNGNVYAFDADSGDELWVTPIGGSITDSQATIVANGVVYVGSLDDIEYAFDAATGELLWSYQTGGNLRKQSVVDGTLYVSSTDSNLYAFRLPGAQG